MNGHPNREPSVRYLVDLEIVLDTAVPYRTILDVVEAVRSEMLGRTGMRNDRERLDFEKDRLLVHKELEWSSEFTIGWNRATLAKLLETHADAIVRLDYSVWERKHWKEEDMKEDRCLRYERPTNETVELSGRGEQR
jgi:hypothetical protein